MTKPLSIVKNCLSEVINNVKKEIIVVNDASSDSSKEKINAFIKDHTASNIIYRSIFK